MGLKAFNERWYDFIDGYKSRLTVVDPDNVKEALIGRTIDCVNNIRNSDPNRLAKMKEDDFIEDLTAAVSKDQSFHNHLEDFRKQNEFLQELKTTRREYDWADSVTHVRNMIYRIATAIGIATVVVVTYWVAHKLEIPLPLLRMQIP